MVQQFLPRLTRIRLKQYLLTCTGKSFLPFKLFTTHSHKKSNHKKNRTYATNPQYSTGLLKKLNVEI